MTGGGRQFAKKSAEKFAQRPFARLAQLFVFRFFHGTGEEADELDFSLGLVLTMLALPGAFASILLFDKYGTLLQWMRGTVNFDPLAAAMPDEYFFVVLSMVVTGAVAVWKWDCIFPDRRDYWNLAPLPVPMRTILLANLAAVVFLTGVLALDVNAASAILFPLVVSASQQTFLFFAGFAAAHAITVVLASGFAFLAVFATLGVLMTFLPHGLFRAVSVYVRALVVISLLALLATSSMVPRLLQDLPQHPASAIRYLPSAWFLGLCQWLRRRADPALASLARSAVFGLGTALGVAILTYASSYPRYFRRIAEAAGTAPSSLRLQLGWLSSRVDRLVFRSPFQRGCSHFVWKTLFRSEPHALVIAGFGGMGLVLASQALLGASESAPSCATPLPSVEALSIPLILVFFITLGLRVAFELPVDLKANWIFRTLLDPEKHEAATTAKKTMLLATLPWVLLLVPPIYAHLAGWLVGGLHAVLVAVWCVLLAELLVLRFRKVPFTCSLPVFQQHAIVMVLACILGFILFATVTSNLEHWALASPLRVLLLIVPAAGFYYFVRRLRRRTLDIDKRLVFEEAAPTAVELLQLGR